MVVNMDNNKLKQLVEKVLKKDERLWNKNKTDLNETLLIDLVENIDEKVIELLLQEKKIREKFFVKIKDVYVFKTNDFRFFIEENKIDNSFTDYKNRIGLTDGKKFLKDTNDVVLDFPYKDCVLEGGQSTEEGTDTYFEYEEEKTKTVKGEKVKEESGYKEKQGKRKEIFFNQVLAHDEIDRLFDHKALTGWKRFTKDGEQEVKEIKRDEDGTIKENLIIKGNNLIALHSLKREFTGKVKLIYIVPPYNTGNDGFKYNDNFNHSTWLTFMKNRLEVARELLDITGTIAISIDNNEQSYLQVLLDEVFRTKNKKNLISVKRSSVSGAKVINNGVVNVSEYIVIYSRNTNNWKPNKVFRAKERDNRYNKYIVNKNNNYEEWEYVTILEAFADFKKIKKSQLRKSLGNEYELELENFIFENSENIIRFAALDDKAISKSVRDMKKISKNDSSKTYIIERDKFSNYYLFRGEAILFFQDRLIEINGKKEYGELITDIWDDVLPNDLHNEGGVSFKKGKKPEKLLQRLIELFSNENDIVLDYHLGSGTTCAVSHKINRHYIGIEQMNYGENDSIIRMKNTINNEQSGISKIVNWQGGGDFIYCELAKWNETAKEKILECESLEELEKLFDEMYEKYFLNYNLKIKEFKEKVIKEDNFKDLSLEEQKKMFVAMLDNNQMYVNKTEMADKKFGIDKKDQKLTEKFYNCEK